MLTVESGDAPTGDRTGRPAASRAPRHACRHLLLWLMVTLLVLPLGGCGGCRRDPNAPLTEEELLEKEQERQRRLAEEAKKKPDYEFVRLSTQPNNVTTVDTAFKPGHWTAATLEARANNFDFKGQLVTEVVDKDGTPISLEGLPYTVQTSRELILPKGQKRLAELSFFSPPHASGNRLKTRLLTGPHGSELRSELIIIQPMPAHQYYFVVLASTPDSYTFLRDINSVAAPNSQLVDPRGEAHYRVIVPRIEHRTPLPSGALAWTAIAYLLWDNLEPDKLTIDQQQAMLDWLHWGGQLIVNGPESLDTLAGSFLSPYLPVQSTGTRELNADDLAELSAGWSHGGRGLSPARPWSGVAWKVLPGAAVIPGTGEMVVESSVGRGRVVVTAFDLAQREIRAWAGFDELFNACLLRRPARRFMRSDDGIERAVAVNWAARAQRNPAWTTRVRYFSRDARTRDALAKSDSPADPPATSGRTAFSPYGGTAQTDTYDQAAPIGPGVAAWSDSNRVALEARDALRRAAGIVVPHASFVIAVLGVYMLVLVPLNWAVFSLLRRIEWAWVAVPVIAVACAVVVVRLAQLDIGFARARTEVAVVEVQAEYDRAHVTRYTALYTSLSTAYDLEFHDSQALALPLATGEQSIRGQTREQVYLRRERAFRMEDFEVGSNTTKLIHSEHMLELGGPIRWIAKGASRRLVNDSQLTLEGAVVVGPEGACWLGTLAPGASAHVLFERQEESLLFAAERDQSPRTSRSGVSQMLNLRGLVELAEKHRADDEIRLVAWTEDELDGLAIDPPAKQNRRGNLIVAHLDYGRPPPPERDVNHPNDFKTAAR